MILWAVFAPTPGAFGNQQTRQRKALENLSHIVLQSFFVIHFDRFSFWHQDLFLSLNV